MKQFFLVIIIFFFLDHQAQDLHFSQFTEQPALVNPALTGAISNLRFSLVTRSQWGRISTPYKTSGASFEIRSPGRYKRTGKFGRAKKRTPGLVAAGLSVYRDIAGDGRLQTLMGNFSLATFVPAGKRNFFSAGLQVGMVQKKIDPSPLIYPDQYTGSGYDPSLIPGEALNSTKFKYPDYAAGVLWTYGSDIKTFIAHHETKARLGMAVYHITRPTQQYQQNSTDEAILKYVAHGDLLFSIEGTHMALAPAFNVQLQGALHELTAGTRLDFYNSNDTKITGYVRRSTFGIGMYYRYGDALIYTFLAELEEQYAIGLSYTQTVSPLKQGAKLGGLELTLRYTPPNSFLYQKK
jgi:type IX secretion system PorP/SprF family membrane protein